MAITNPNVVSKPYVSATGTFTSADQIELADTSSSETAITNLRSAQISWNFSDGILGADPGATNFSGNNALKASVTILTFNTTSNINNVDFQNLLDTLTTGDQILLQESNIPANNVIYLVSGDASLSGSVINVPVTLDDTNGGEFTNGNKVNFTFFFSARGTGGGGSLPQAQQNWLNQTTSQEIPSTTVTNIAPTVTDSLIWRRAAIVQQSGIGDSGTGLLIAEANRQSDGTFDRASGTSVYDDDLANSYIYVGITASDFNNLTLNATFLEARRGGELVFSASLESLADPEVIDGITTGQFAYRRTNNNQYHYVNGDVLTVVTRDTTQTTQYNYNAPAGDFTPNINDLPFSAVDEDFTGRVNGPANHQELTAADTVKLTGLLVSTATSSGEITVSYKDGPPTANIADYNKTWNAANPVLANFGSQRIVSILVNNNVSVSSVSGGATLGPQLLWIPRHYIYQVTLPAEVSTGTPTSHLPSGVTETFLPIGFNENFKIVRGNVESNLLAQIDQHGSGANISSIETKLNTLFPLTPDVDILINWANIYDPIHGAATVDIVDGYSLIADYRSSTVRYESAGLTFGTGTNVITYSGLTENLHRSFAFALPQVDVTSLTGTSGTANIPFNGVNYLVTFNTDLTTTASDFVTTHATAIDTAGAIVTANAGVLTFRSTDPSVTFTLGRAVNVTGDLASSFVSPAMLTNKTLMWIVDGGSQIPFIDITTGGNIRINSYTPEETTSQVVTNQAHFLTKQSGPATISQGSGNQRFALPNFPAGATNTSRTLQISPEIFLNGVNTFAAGFDPAVTIPATNTAQALQTVEHTFNLGPLYGNRLVTITTGYEFIVDGADLDVRLTVQSAPSDISVDFEGDTNVLLNYTAQNTVARVDNFINLSDAGGDYTFIGHEEFIISARPAIGTDGNPTGILEMVPASVGSSGVINQLNDANIRTPTPLWTDIQVADDIGFKTFVADHYFRHNEVAGLLQHRTERFAYGLARHQTINSGHSFRQAVDLANGSTIGGSPIGPGTLKAEQVVYEAQNKSTGANGLVESVTLPANYAIYNYVHVTEYDSSSLQFRHAEFPTHILSAGLVDANDNIRLQGNSIMRWTAGTRTLDFNPTAQEILRITLKD